MSKINLHAAVLLCLAGTVNAADTGDAPASYGVASHEVVPDGPFLGDLRPDDNSPAESMSASADDDDGVDDEDGVFAFPVLVQNGKSYDTNVFASNPLTVPVVVSAWIDFDGNGTFDADEYTSDIVPAITDDQKFKVVWPDLSGVTSDFTGNTYARFRISSTTLTASQAIGSAPDGEVEDYVVEVQRDSDGDEIPDTVDVDNDNDGIPDSVEGVALDTDNDGVTNNLDGDSDADGIPDFIEAGQNPLTPTDTDNDNVPDFLDLDSDGNGIADSDEQQNDMDRDGLTDAVEGQMDNDADGIANFLDLDSDNDTIPDAIERGQGELPADTDGDGIADYLDLDSDNDGIVDIREANVGVLSIRLFDIDNDGRIDNEQLTGANGFLDRAETAPGSGIPIFAVVDSDRDGIRDFRDLDSDNDSVSDLLETLGVDADANGLLDSSLDENNDGLVDGGNSLVTGGSYPDSDRDKLPDFQDSDADGRNSPIAVDESPGDGSVDQSSSGQGVVITGAGCSIAPRSSSLQSHGASDAFFWLMLSACIVALGLRRNKRRK